ncbi:GroES-like protein [Ophiobolus disseminans]|uniref:GroES-like protein n=1 Tax=Ophiobolus disseminans TaxID=1469910 RepID=A0A6A7A5S7_9PLEO|nr:GroES-like protein [Ophiobolus disseminans]
MKEAIVHSAEKVEIIDSPIPTPESDQVVIRVIASGCNPKDWKVAELYSKAHNTGDDIAGIVHAVGANVYEFKPGDRVAAFHEMMKPGGSFAEYAVAWQYMTSHIPDNISFEEASTIPLAGLTAVIGNYARLGLPEPWRPATEKIPFLVYGAASAVGAFAIKLARLSNIHPIIGVAGRGIPFAESLIDKSKGDVILDYRNGNEAVVAGIKAALEKAATPQIYHAFDAVADNGSHNDVVSILAPEGRVTYVFPLELTAPPGFSYPKTYKSAEFSNVAAAYGENKEQGFIYLRWLFRMVMEGKFAAHPYEVVPGGLAGVSQALQNLKAGKASAVKYVFKVPDTDGAGQN